MKTSERIVLLSAAALTVLLTSGTALAAYDENATAPGYVKRSATEEKALKTSSSGVNVQGESGNFDDYLNDDLFPTEEEIRLMDVDPNSRVVLGGGEDAAGVSFKKSYEKSPVAE